MTRYLLSPRQEGHRFRRDPLFPADEAQLLRGLRLDVDGIGIDTEVGGQVGAHRRDMRGHARRLSDDGGVHVDDVQVALAEQLPYRIQELAAGDVLVARVGVRKVRTDVAQAGRTQERIAHRMYQHIRVGVPREPLLEGDLHAADNELAPGDESVRVKSLSNAHSRLSAISYEL